MMNLAQLECVACRGNLPMLTESEIYQRMPQVPEWRVKEVDGEKRLERVFKFQGFAQALDFTNQVGSIAEKEDHHPLIILEYGQVTVDWWTHKIHGLHQNDFVMAARTDQLYSRGA